MMPIEIKWPSHLFSSIIYIEAFFLAESNNNYVFMLLDEITLLFNKGGKDVVVSDYLEKQKLVCLCSIA